jgi:hypothetical protein
MDQKEIEWKRMRIGFLWLRMNHRWDRVNTKLQTVQTGRKLPKKLSD